MYRVYFISSMYFVPVYHTLDTQKSMKPLFGHAVSKYRLRPWPADWKNALKTYLS